LWRKASAHKGLGKSASYCVEQQCGPDANMAASDYSPVMVLRPAARGTVGRGHPLELAAREADVSREAGKRDVAEHHVGDRLLEMVELGERRRGRDIGVRRVVLWLAHHRRPHLAGRRVPRLTVSSVSVRLPFESRHRTIDPRHRNIIAVTPLKPSMSPSGTLPRRAAPVEHQPAARA
jgi:hypothetical protein